MCVTSKSYHKAQSSSGNYHIELVPFIAIVLYYSLLVAVMDCSAADVECLIARNLHRKFNASFLCEFIVWVTGTSFSYICHAPYVVVPATAIKSKRLKITIMRYRPALLGRQLDEVWEVQRQYQRQTGERVNIASRCLLWPSPTVWRFHLQ